MSDLAGPIITLVMAAVLCVLWYLTGVEVGQDNICEQWCDPAPSVRLSGVCSCGTSEGWVPAAEAKVCVTIDYEPLPKYSIVGGAR